MDLNQIALWMAALPAATLFWKNARAPHRPLGWLMVTALVVLTAIGGWFYFRSYAGYVAGALALLFVFLPTWANNAAARAGNRFQYGRARRFFTVAALFHPLDGWPAMPRLFEAFELAHQGKTADAEALLRVLARGTGNTASIARAQRLRILGRWRELKALAEQTGLLTLGRDPTLLVLYLRALGELGELDDLAEFMRAQEPALLGTGALDAGLLYLFGFSGRVELTRLALGGSRQVYSAEARDFWLALAAKNAGDLEEARRAFGGLRTCPDAQIRERAEEHFRSLLRTGPPEPLSARTLATIDHFARLARQRHNLMPNSPGQRTERRMVLLLIAANAAVYVNGSYPKLVDTHEHFVERWAFFAPDILSGEWWRVFSYLFVHANAIHLLMNMGGLWVLGPFVERAFGRLRFGLIYLISGSVGSAVYLALSWYGVIEPEPLVGASGCIMGLLGATAAVMLRAWIRQRAAIARQIFFRLLAVVLLQVVFDFSTNYINRGDPGQPQIAGLAHALGLLGGFIAALLLRESVSPEQSVASLA